MPVLAGRLVKKFSQKRRWRKSTPIWECILQLNEAMTKIPSCNENVVRQELILVLKKCNLQEKYANVSATDNILPYRMTRHCNRN